MTELKTTPLPELLAPAGSPAALYAAVAAGADAVYMGGGRFNARMRAKNFSAEDMRRALALCRAHGVKSHITLNIRMYDRELSDFLSDAYNLLSDGADAFIVADLGAAELLRRRFPEAELHASTQLTGQTAADGAALKRLGFSRMVCPREMSLDDVSELVRSSPLDIEMFIHGAHCVCVSGQCLASFVMGGRSGNRGECAQPCRLPYGRSRGETGHPLSLKDMCLASHITEIISSGVRSLKIEGRQKSAEYTAGAVKIYRRLLDEHRDADAAEIEELRRLFSRDGFTDGYFRGDMRSMTGMRSGEYSAAPAAALPEPEPVPLSAHFTLTDREAALEMKSPFGRAVSRAAARERREGEAALSPAAAEKNTARLGGTPFQLKSFSCDIDPDAFFTLSGLNALRRDCVRSLTLPERHTAPAAISAVRRYTPQTEPDGRTLKTAVFESIDQITSAAEEYFDEIYIPWYLAAKCGGSSGEYGAFLPPLAFGSAFYRALEQTAKCPRLLCHTPGQIAAALDAGVPAHASFRLGVFNGECAAAVRGMGAASVTLSPELTLRQAEDIPGEGMIVWGRLPLMLLRRCVISDGGKHCAALPRGYGGYGGMKNGGLCIRDGELCRSALYDRRGECVPVIGRADCTNVMYNSRPIYMADKLNSAALRRCGRHVYLFSTETAAEVDRVISAYSAGLPAASFGGEYRRIPDRAPQNSR